jgi:hypothetical protein
MWKTTGEFVRTNGEKGNPIGWRQTLTASPSNHIYILLVRVKKFAKAGESANIFRQLITKMKS